MTRRQFNEDGKVKWRIWRKPEEQGHHGTLRQFWRQHIRPQGQFPLGGYTGVGGRLECRGRRDLAFQDP
jgi:hypothetical protein